MVGTITLLMGAWIGCAKDDIKKVLAGSTMSQIGYMILAAGLGVAGYAFAIFHLLTHGFFKANMFLGAGSVMHGTNDDVDMRHYGALRKLMPVTFLTFTMGYLAIIGFPGFSGFWSKDKIIETALAQNPWLGICALFGAGVTGFYMTRLMLLTFFTKERWEDGVHPHESPKVMTVPADRARGALGARWPAARSTTGSSTFLAPVTGVPVHEEPPLPAARDLHARRADGRRSGSAWPGSSSGGVTCRASAPTKVSVFTTAGRNELYGDAFNNALIVGPGKRSPPGWPPSTDRWSTAGSSVRRPPSVALSGHMRLAQNGFVRSYALSAARRARHRPARPRGGEPRMTLPWLTILLLLPILGSLVLVLVPGRFLGQAAQADRARLLGGDARPRPRARLRLRARRRHAVHRGPRWIRLFGAHYALGLDGIGLTLVLLTVILTPS